MSTTSPPLTTLGVNVAGFLRGGLGLGQAARLYVEALTAAGVPVRTTSVDVRLPTVAGAAPKHADFADLEAEGELPFNLVCVNAPELPAFYGELGHEFFEDRYTIGVWAWETDVVPASWDRAFAMVDEIWVYSSYVVELLSHAAPCPVVRMPLPIVAPQATGVPLSFPMPDGFTFLFIFDFFSTLQRKNPLGLIEAFTRAFQPGEGPQLLLKSFNGDYKPERLAQLRAAAAGRDDIHIVDRFVSEAERATLMARADCYVSLHRSEGFGLTLGEAMALGKPVIGTAFSSTLDFMTRHNSYLVDYEMTEVGPEGENYPAEGHWAEPDLRHAAALMREVWEDQDGARARGARGARDIAEAFSVDAVGELARARLRRIARTGRRGGSRAVPAAGANGRGAGGSLPRGALGALGRLTRSGRAGGSGDRPPGHREPSLLNLPWLEHAEAKVGFDPRADAARRGGAVGLARRTLLQAMRPYTHHQDELNSVVVDGLREIDDRLDDVDAQLRRLRGLGELGLSGNSRLDLARVLEAARARPGSNHPAISHFDDKGQRVLGFRGADAAGAEGYRGFEDIFRGDEEQVRAGQEPYLDLFAGCDWVLDVGCGRGEFLDGLCERGVKGRGVDLDPTMVERCRQKGHDVHLGDAASYLGALEDGTVPGIFAAQVIEHLSADQLTELLGLLHRKLAAGGLVVMETVNPHSPPALKAFWTDTTHHHPLFPEVTLALCRLHGFDAGEVLLPQASGDFDEDIYVSRDYAVVARKAAG